MNAASQSNRVFKLLAEEMKEFLPMDEPAVRKIVDEKIAEAQLPRSLEIKCNGQLVGKVDGLHHKGLESLLGLVEEGRNNLLMVGPAGSGKTTLAKNLAKALGLDFGFISLSAGVSETHLFGRILPQADNSWKYQPSRFVEIYENGGLFLLDEIDAADPNVMVAVNAALANGVLANPNGMIHHRHEKTIIVGAANTWGRGADHQYVGRNPLDAATLDRFVLATVHINYDEKLERMFVESIGIEKESADELVEWVNNLRERIARNRLRRVASTRLLVNAANALKAGRNLSDVKDRYFMDWSADEIAKVS